MTKSMPIDHTDPIEPPGAAARETQAGLLRLRAMLSHAEEVREIEKQRLARELHNDFGSTLTALAMRLAILARQPAGEGAAEQWAKANALLAELSKTARRVQAELRPGVLNVAGLSMALEEALEDFAEQGEIGYGLKLPEEEPQLEQERATALYRMFQEVLSNVRRHANASRVDVALACADGKAQLTVVDDGGGFEPAQTDFSATHGLRRIAERAEFLGGEMRLESAPQRGTAISVILPLADGADADIKTNNINFLTSTIGKP